MRCLGCSQKLEAGLSFDILSTTKYCDNKDCDRYGLVTALCLEEKKDDTGGDKCN